MKGKFGESLPHFTPCQTPVSSGVNLFAHDLSRYEPFLERIYVFPLSILVGPVLCLRVSGCHVRYLSWMCIRENIGGRWSSVGPRGLFKLACKGDSQALLIPSKEGWINHSNILGDLWILLVEF